MRNVTRCGWKHQTFKLKIPNLNFNLLLMPLLECETFLNKLEKGNTFLTNYQSSKNKF